MELLNAILLGIIQGITEFLPISSDGHLFIGQMLLGVEQSDPHQALLFTAVLHAATTLSIIVVFWKDIVEILRDLLKFQWNENTRFSAWVLISMIPAGIVGILLKEYIEPLHQPSYGNLILTGFMLALTGLLLFASSRIKASSGELNPWKAFVIGIFQAAAMLPGLSRSGSTISTSLALGIDRMKATRFSFLMVVPVILGGTLLELKDYFESPAAQAAQLFSPLEMGAGFVTAFVFGLLACRWMIALVRRSKLDYFAWYCIAIGLVAIVAGFIQL
jgi:undecaprenyl-diphosphatase